MVNDKMTERNKKKKFKLWINLQMCRYLRMKDVVMKK